MDMPNEIIRFLDRRMTGREAAERFRDNEHDGRKIVFLDNGVFHFATGLRLYRIEMIKDGWRIVHFANLLDTE